jgi:hypothetical protein
MASEEFGFDAEEFEKNATGEAKKGMLVRPFVWSLRLCIVRFWHRPWQFYLTHVAQSDRRCLPLLPTTTTTKMII